MVRTTIACAWCRRSKIKCVHNGSAPCRHCLKAGRTSPGDCTLAGPFGAAGRQPRLNRREREGGSNRGGKESESIAQGLANNIPSASPSLHQSPQVAQPPGDIVAQTPPSVVVRAAGLFRRKFPELAFLHLPTFDPTNQQHAVQVAAMLAACKRLMPSSQGDPFTADDYARYARGQLSRVPSDSPNRSTVQALLTMSMYEWGSCNGYGAWMYSGMATRMMQCLYVWKPRHASAESERQMNNRTYWGCFIMDRFMSCGRSQPAALSIDSMPITLPSGDQDFAFGSSSTGGDYTFADLRDSPAMARSLGTIDNYYSVLVRGFDIWAQTLKFVTDGGRRQPAMASPDSCPWVPGSPWKRIYDSLIAWRSSQDSRLTYPPSPVSVHVSLGNGESFAFVNLLYYLSILFLNREYIPFLPTPDSEPQGPVDPPALQALAPLNWWTDRARELFDGAAAITDILKDLSDLGSPLLTPFAGFCAFSAATMNLYVAAFPRMDLGRSHKAAAMAQTNIEYLDEFRRLWKMGNGWWRTSKRTRKLYQAAAAHRERFYGKTRADFLALEASIHDYSGTSPSPEEIIVQEASYPSQDKIPQQLSQDHAAAASLQEISLLASARAAAQPHSTAEWDNLLLGNAPATDPWNELWPMWGEFESNPV